MAIKFVCVYSGVQHVLTMWETWRVSYKSQEQLSLGEHQVKQIYLVGVRVAHRFSFNCSALFLFCLSSHCHLCTQWCQRLWIVHSWLSLRFSLTFIWCISVLGVSILLLFCKIFRNYSDSRFFGITLTVGFSELLWQLFFRNYSDSRFFGITLTVDFSELLWQLVFRNYSDSRFFGITLTVGF